MTAGVVVGAVAIAVAAAAAVAVADVVAQIGRICSLFLLPTRFAKKT